MENRYDKYKDSGIAWIGEIPEHWEVKRLKNVSDFNPPNDQSISNFSEVGYLPMERLKNGYMLPSVINVYNLTQGLTFFKENDIVMAKVTPCFENGNIAIAKNLINNCGFGSSELFIFRVRSINRKYFFYLLQEEKIKEVCKSTMIGTGGLKRISPTFMRNLLLPIPPILEQQSIATYLDQKCGEIDELITLQEEMITKLQSYKQSVITEAVTKGLDKNVPLKDSGIEWIGEIPEHWNICKLKNIFLLSTGTTPKDFDQTSEEDNLINWYTPSDILDSCNDLFSSQRKLSEKVIYANKISLFPIGTLLYVGIGASAGKVGYANENGYSNQQITGLIPLNCYSRFYFYYLSALKDKIRDNAFFTTLPIINNAYLGQELIPFPTISEQQSITDYLDRKCSEIDELISIKQQKIEKLKNYKKSLIFECVTGKRKV